MPYIQDSEPQKKSGLPGVKDVYHSPNVYVNNVAVALWLAPGNSAGFAGATAAPKLVLDPVIAAAATALVDSYVANPGNFYNLQAETDGVKPNFAGTVEDGTTGTGIISEAIADGIIPFLKDRLTEAGRGMWRESGQGGKASNTNITNIWSVLGYPAASPWTTDQTAWCMGFVNFTLKNAGYKFVQTASAKAIASDPTRWGATQVQPADVAPGDIVLWKYSHVNFVYTVNDGKCTFVGGNQTPTAGTNNNPSDGDITISYAGGSPATNPNISSIWRPSKS
jgi:hypothetical protein